MELDLRSENALQLADLADQVRSLVEAARRGSIEVTMERIGFRPPGELARSHPLITKTQAILEEMGLKVYLDIASTEANLPLSRGFPAITIGLTSGDHAHTSNEYINTAAVGNGMTQLLKIIERIWD
jgi:acetylornithine deacetylase/succinyl-diaminopimelate desuccinylase-like protein